MRPRQALCVCCRLMECHLECAPDKPCVSVADIWSVNWNAPLTSPVCLLQTYGVSFGRRPRQALHVCCRHMECQLECAPDKPCVSVADCSESSVLRSCILGPYVPLRRTPSESVSAIRHTGLRRRGDFRKGISFM